MRLDKLENLQHSQHQRPPFTSKGCEINNSRQSSVVFDWMDAATAVVAAVAAAAAAADAGWTE